jgi:DNA-binding XRE family transcriptional regulator
MPLNHFKQSLVDLLVMIRGKAKLTVVQMAQAIGVGMLDYVRMERTSYGLKVSHLMKAAKLIGGSIDIQITPKEVK